MAGDEQAAVPDEVVRAALQAAQALGVQVSDAPIGVIAARAGMSRSTLLRRLGGTRKALDAAVRAVGVDPGGQPLRDRALAAAAELISEVGVGHVTLEAIAARARCSVDSLYSTIGNRDSLLAAVFAQYSPLVDMDATLATDLVQGADLTQTVEHMYRRYVTALLREPRLTPALVAEGLSRPNSEAVRSIVEQNSPRLIDPVRRWLQDQMTEGTIRTLPLDVLLVQFLAPVLLYATLQQTLSGTGGVIIDIDTACGLFADAFVRAVENPM